MDPRLIEPLHRVGGGIKFAGARAVIGIVWMGRRGLSPLRSPLF